MPSIVCTQHWARKVRVFPIFQQPNRKIIPFVSLHTIDAQAHFASRIMPFGLFVSVNDNLEQVGKVSPSHKIVGFQKYAAHIGHGKWRVFAVEIIESLIHGIICQYIECINSEMILIQSCLLEYLLQRFTILGDYHVSLSLQFASNKLNKLLGTRCGGSMNVIVDLERAIKVISQQTILRLLFNRTIKGGVHFEGGTEHLQSLKAKGSYGTLTDGFDQATIVGVKIFNRGNSNQILFRL
mmetsp:Transcript_15718/g.32526  ORF Transcript_15718/g.32526 Transcript_15718/m.32526 type:complete len:239 (-) Transcript_15718:586-1302(-)